jgi:hypothetical protein
MAILEEILAQLNENMVKVVSDMGDIKSSVSKIEANQGHQETEIKNVKSILVTMPVTCEMGKRHEEVLKKHIEDHEKAEQEIEKKKVEAGQVDAAKDRKRFGWGGFITGIIAILLTIALKLFDFFFKTP